MGTVSSGPPEPSRCQMQRENGAQVRPPPPQVRAAETITSERSHQQLIMREVQQKPSWKEMGGGGGGGRPPATPGPSSADPDALRTVQTFIMLEQRRRADFSIDSILKFDH